MYPPPFAATVLRALIAYLDGKPEVSLLVIGDFNCCLDPAVDRHPAVGASALSRGTPLARLLQEVGWVDVWRQRNPGGKLYSCFSKSHGSLSRIDLGVGNAHMLQYVSKMEYRPRSVSDHSPLIVHLVVSQPTELPKAPWKFNAFWLKLFDSPEIIEESVRGFFTAQDPQGSCVQQWEAFKLFLKRVLVTEINKVKKASSAFLLELEGRVEALEGQFVLDPSDSAREDWQAPQSAYQHLLSSSDEKEEVCCKAGIF